MKSVTEPRNSSFVTGQILYHLISSAWFLTIRWAAPFRKKARQWVDGQNELPKRLDAIAPKIAEGEYRIWMHCASLGEYEQGRPLLEALSAQVPNCRIYLTFFSPSGKCHFRNTDLVSWVDYLPTDTPHNARHFLSALNPDLVIFVKYEFWFYLLREAHIRRIPLVLAAAHFRPQQIFFRWYGGIYRRMLGFFTTIFVQDRRSEELLAGIGIAKVTVAGDTRVDRVAAIAREPFCDDVVSAFANGQPTLIAGSTWPADERLLLKALSHPKTANWKLIIAPHVVEDNRLSELEAVSPLPLVRLSKASKEAVGSARILLVDCIGRLAYIYRYGTAAYVGGGFEQQGIHNILEPAACAVPALFGPLHHRFHEAKALLQNGGAAVVSNTSELIDLLCRFESDETLSQNMGAQCRKYIAETEGATKRMMEVLDEMGWLAKKSH